MEPRPRSPSQVVCWRRPLEGWFKLNIDGSSRGNPGEAWGNGVCRGEKRDFCFGFHEGYGVASNTRAELQVIHDGMMHCLRLGYSNIIVESDSLLFPARDWHKPVFKVHVVSIETITPSSPTPHPNRTFHLSLLDQIAPSLYVPFILFYSGNGHCNTEHSDVFRRQKKSLSETLTLFYPFAGRIREEDQAVDCNDEGIEFFEAQINGRLFENTLFPQREAADFTLSSMFPREKTNVLTKMFLFNRQNIAKLRARAPEDLRPTRVEAVTALIWRSIMWAQGKPGMVRVSVAMLPVSLRSRMVPPLPDHSFGNLCVDAVSSWVSDGECNEDLQLCLERLLRYSIRKIDSEYVAELRGRDGLIKAFELLTEVFEKYSEYSIDICLFSSHCRFPYYEADFGWGRPIYKFPIEFLLCIYGPYNGYYMMNREKTRLSKSMDSYCLSKATLDGRKRIGWCTSNQLYNCCIDVSKFRGFDQEAYVIVFLDKLQV
ncbi:(13S,14R)-1,13-dihydroxy-N-methylcanadine 13-O-acetyltransferase AT1-like [Magnolia sinica]|uniref:(13S,14R)-1,13-dihydroxy-N-methylcanadine 13-O-acetyltransferase AT1-like n=1 Tax=Magnolia sinica TaxID=86752 RepID=UPI00265AA505|nr:(13S,14R)-1,13-dihydroxy-N-methylcanadine 13-O-acetyltransferase AT1-like [Magnolia sinica]